MKRTNRLGHGALLWDLIGLTSRRLCNRGGLAPTVPKGDSRRPDGSAVEL
jgi:hypothetical protein